MSKDWNLKGHYFEACSCNIVCPCIFLQDPTKGICEGYLVWRIDEGQMNGVDLSGLNVAVALHAPGNLAHGGMKVVFYIDNKATAEQKDALTEIYGGKAGGHPAVIASLVGELLGFESADVKVDFSDKVKKLTIEGVGGITMEAIGGANEADPVTVHNNPLSVSPLQPLTIHKVENVDFKDHGMQWKYEGTGGLSAPFAYAP